MEENYFNNETTFKGAFDTSPIGMALVSTEGIWLHVNSALSEMLGYTPDELNQLTFQDITHNDDLEKDLQQVKQMLDGDIETYQMEKRYHHKDGHVVWAILSVSLVKNAGGKPLHFVSQVQDITLLKEAQKKLKEKVADLEKMNDYLVDRERKMIDLKDEVNSLLVEMGREKKY